MRFKKHDFLTFAVIILYKLPFFLVGGFFTVSVYLSEMHDFYIFRFNLFFQSVISGWNAF